ncbi:M48 family metalloprotease [Pelomonas aquatica]|uniref:Peptidase M48 n=2 Tax=Pelomonas aquatica TaxID=431058 RepID=A0A9X4R6J0_9BURK|nr:M48 family metalloprotease [Pelomonas aquatica]MDG0864821.1 peptidase M48 [Pelomonas aquatica]
MKEWVCSRERTLGAVLLVLGVLVWLGLIVGTFGVMLIVLLFGFVAYVFAQSALVAHVRGNGVQLGAEQFPDLHGQFVSCCEKLGLDKQPEAYVLQGGGMLNAFAAQFLGHRFVVLLSGVVDAMQAHPDGVRFYVGHELGHLRRGHAVGGLLRMPVLWLPLIGGAYARAKETSCDLHGLACSSSGESAARALAALASGPQRWQQMDMKVFARQSRHGAGFWMSFHELASGYPWLTKRVARVMGANRLPGRNPLAYVLAAFVPYAGRLGGGFGLLLMVYLIGVLAAVAIPQYQAYTIKAKLVQAVQASNGAREALAQQYLQSGQIPESLAAAGLPEMAADGSRLSLDAEGMVLTVQTPRGALVFTPHRDEKGGLGWECAGRTPLTAQQLPAGCMVAEGTGKF